MELRCLFDMIISSDHIVFFGGAGVSTESGIPDFRSVNGLYYEEYDYSPEVMLSSTFFREHKKEFYDFYKKKLIYPEAKPNYAHNFLASLEKSGRLSGIVTQNIDNLHFMAGSKSVYELHGNVHRNYCMKCGAFYSLDDFLGLKEPFCTFCSGYIKPDVVLYEEGLSEKTVTGTIDAIKSADMLVIAGTSLAVYPAASFVGYYNRAKFKKLVVINKTTLNLPCDLEINGAVAETFKALSFFGNIPSSGEK